MQYKIQNVTGTMRAMRATRTKHGITLRVALDDEVTLDLEVFLEPDEFGRLLVDEPYEAECVANGTVEAPDPDEDE